ncbi:MAG: nitroreductase family protein [Oscillospiraceae bacterium]|nr:nitroreductase family protein [Oscillospiraceae bacterium]
MNETIQQLHERKSVRVYEDRPIEPEIKQAILAAAIQAPSAGNMALYTILDITDQAIKDKLAVSCDNQPFIATAPLVLIFCADYRRWYDVFRAHVEQVRKPGMGDLFLAQADTLIAAQNAVVAAHSLGLGSCYIGDITENFEYHRELLNLPQYVVPTAMLCMGYPTQQQLSRPKPPRHAVEALVHENGYRMEKAAQMEQMLAAQQHKDGEELADYIRRFCKRKWNSEFSQEMSRSCTEIVKSWCAKEEL